MQSVEIKKLCFGYNSNKLVLDNLDFHCKDGSINVLLGLNGCGKTTLIKCIAGLLTPQCGEILVDGKNLKEISIKNRARIMSYVSQKNSNIDDFLVFDYLSFGTTSELAFYSSPKEEQKEKIKKQAERFNIAHLLNKRLGELPGGERQIVSICSAIIQDTKIVVLDEPTSALDIKNQNIVLTLIKQIAKEEKRTFILSSHNPNHALFLDSSVCLLKDGKVADFGTAKEVITVDRLKPIYGEDVCLSSFLPYDEISFCRK